MLILCAAGIAYSVVALLAVLRFERRSIPSPPRQPAITILKPVHGLEPELYENLRSFCDQRYPRYQVIFGVQRHDDPAIPVIQSVILACADRDLELVIGAEAEAGNPKIANLRPMLARARYDVFAIADADMRVDSGYLAALAAEFDDARTGAVTCLYAGVSHGGTASALAALQLNDQFAPSVLVATLGAPLRFCFGSTMAVRRAALDAVGGLDALAPHLADDYTLGRLVAERGYRVALSRYVVRNVVHEPDVRALFSHELRWARTIRMVRPLGYALSFLTYPVPWALFWLAFSHGAPLAWLALFASLVVRYAIDRAVRRAFAIGPAPAWLLPLRDCLGLAIWACGLAGTSVRWQDRTLVAGGRGLL